MEKDYHRKSGKAKLSKNATKFYKFKATPKVKSWDWGTVQSQRRSIGTEYWSLYKAAGHVGVGCPCSSFGSKVKGESRYQNAILWWGNWRNLEKNSVWRGAVKVKCWQDTFNWEGKELNVKSRSSSPNLAQNKLPKLLLAVEAAFLKLQKKVFRQAELLSSFGKA